MQTAVKMFNGSFFFMGVFIEFTARLPELELTKIRGTENVGADDPEKSPEMTIPGNDQQLDKGDVEDGPDESLDPVVDVHMLFCTNVSDPSANPDYFTVEQHKDPEVLEYVNSGLLPSDSHRAWRLVSEGLMFVAVDDILYYLDPKQENQKRAVVPTQQLRKQILQNAHSSQFGGHFSTCHYCDIDGGERCFKTLLSHVQLVL